MIDFTNLAILCSTWDEMERLNRIAKSQGAHEYVFDDIFFNELGCKYFAVADRNKITMLDSEEVARYKLTETTFTEFTNKHHGTERDNSRQ